MLTPELEVRRVRGKGRGVFAKRSFAKGSVIMDCPVLVGRDQDMNSGILANYTFSWARGKSALALGWGSLLNHACPANAMYRFLHKRQLIRIVAHRDIVAGEEILINYNYTPDDATPVEFD